MPKIPEASREVAPAMHYARRGTLFVNNPTAQVGL